MKTMKKPIAKGKKDRTVSKKNLFQTVRTVFRRGVEVVYVSFKRF